HTISLRDWSSDVCSSDLSVIAGAALAVSACGSKTENTTDANMVTDMNATEGMDTTTDNMTAVDGAMNGGMMANDTMGNDMMMSKIGRASCRESVESVVGG